MYKFINTTEKQYTEYLQCSNPAEDSIELQNQVSQKQNEDSDLNYDWNDDWNEPYVKNDIDYSPPIIEDLFSPYLILSKKESALIDEFYKELQNISEENSKNTSYKSDGSVLKSNFERVDYLIDKYLKKGIRLNVLYDGYKNTISYSIFEELANIVSIVIEITPTTRVRIDSLTGEDAVNELTGTDNFEFLISIVNKLLLAGANYLCNDRRINDVMLGNDESTLAKLEEIQNILKNEAYKSIVNSDKHPEDLRDLRVEIDNTHLFISYPENSSVEVAKITNSKVSRDLGIKESILKIGDNIVKVKEIERKRNYTNVIGEGVTISFPTKVGIIKIHLYPDETDSNKVKVKLDKKNQNKIDKLTDKSIFNKSFFLGGKNVIDAIKDGSFEVDGNVHTQSVETAEQLSSVGRKRKIPSSFMEKVCSVKKLFCGSSVGKT